MVSENDLFQGQKFWLSHKVPTWSHLIGQVKAHGGLVVDLENEADLKIVDHLKKSLPTGTHSYTYITQSIRNGSKEDPADHVAGPAAGTIRRPGSSIPARSGRTPFTAEDDRVLYDWVKREEVKGGKVRGLAIYEQLAAIVCSDLIATCPVSY